LTILRFPNPGSDMGRLMNSYKVIWDAAEQDNGQIDIDGMTRALVSKQQASSSGAVGAEALRRSTRIDRSRDPLFNQSKMYSELFRMLGWLWVRDKRSLFRTTPFGYAIVDNLKAGRRDQLERLLQYSLIGITLPSPHTELQGVTNHRPFSFFLRLMEALEGWIDREELIVGVLAIRDDRIPNVFADMVAKLTANRTRAGAIDRAAAAVASANHVQHNTLQNYTRFPLGAIAAPEVGWAVEGRVKIHGETRIVRRLTHRGRAMAAQIVAARDVREADIEAFSLEQRAQFANYSMYSILENAGYDPAVFAVERQVARAGCKRLLDSLGIDQPGTFIYSPAQQASLNVLDLAERLAA